MNLFLSLLLLCSVGFSQQAEVVVTPEDFGAVGDGKTSDWLPIQNALAFCSTIVYKESNQTNTWCRVRFSKSYVSGPLVINSSRTTLEILQGAEVLMLPKVDYETVCPQKGCPFISTSP